MFLASSCKGVWEFLLLDWKCIHYWGDVDVMLCDSTLPPLFSRVLTEESRTWRGEGGRRRAGERRGDVSSFRADSRCCESKKSAWVLPKEKSSWESGTNMAATDGLDHVFRALQGVVLKAVTHREVRVVSVSWTTFCLWLDDGWTFFSLPALGR